MDSSENEQLVRSCFKKLLDSPNKTLAAGRFEHDVEKEILVWRDILYKLGLKPGQNFFNIGCGWSAVTDASIEYCSENQISLCLMDAAEIIEKVRNELAVSDAYRKKIEFMEGYFPRDLPRGFFKHCRFDRIVAYSVLHYADDPEDFVTAAASMIAPGGRLLIGDIPNLNQRARFLCSKLGQQFEAEYQEVSIDQIPKYKNEQEVIAAYQAEKDGTDKLSNWSFSLQLNDAFIDKMMKHFHGLGMEAYAVPQPDELPFSRTRHDLLVVRYD